MVLDVLMIASALASNSPAPVLRYFVPDTQVTAVRAEAADSSLLRLERIPLFAGK